MATNIIVPVIDGNLVAALAKFKKACLITRLFKEMKKRAYYEKPSVKRKSKQAEARKKERKRMRPMIEHARRLEAQGR
jgi:small subunit ribosomal protein S21